MRIWNKKELPLRGDPQLIDGILALAEQQRLQDNLQKAFNLLAPLAETKMDNALVQFEMGLIYDVKGSRSHSLLRKSINTWAAGR